MTELGSTNKSKPDLKIILLGTMGVGKTSLATRYSSGTYESNLNCTIVPVFHLKRWKTRLFALWDTAGQDHYFTLTSHYCRDASAALIVFDLTQLNSFEVLEKYYDLLIEKSPDCYVVFVGTKYDIVEKDQTERQVSIDASFRYARSKNSTVIETSAKTGFNIDLVFDTIGEHFFGPDGTKNPKTLPPTPLHWSQPKEVILLDEIIEKKSNSDEQKCCD